MEELSAFAAFLKASGPYGFVVCLGYALWRINERKDAVLRELFDRIAEMGERQTEATVKMEAALVALREAIRDRRD